MPPKPTKKRGKAQKRIRRIPETVEEAENMKEHEIGFRRDELEAMPDELAGVVAAFQHFVAEQVNPQKLSTPRKTGRYADEELDEYEQHVDREVKKNEAGWRERKRQEAREARIEARKQVMRNIGLGILPPKPKPQPKKRRSRSRKRKTVRRAQDSSPSGPADAMSPAAQTGGSASEGEGEGEIDRTDTEAPSAMDELNGSGESGRLQDSRFEGAVEAPPAISEVSPSPLDQSASPIAAASTNAERSTKTTKPHGDIATAFGMLLDGQSKASDKPHPQGSPPTPRPATPTARPGAMLPDTPPADKQIPKAVSKAVDASHGPRPESAVRSQTASLLPAPDPDSLSAADHDSSALHPTVRTDRAALRPRTVLRGSMSPFRSPMAPGLTITRTAALGTSLLASPTRASQREPSLDLASSQSSFVGMPHAPPHVEPEQMGQATTPLPSVPEKRRAKREGSGGSGEEGGVKQRFQNEEDESSDSIYESEEELTAAQPWMDRKAWKHVTALGQARSLLSEMDMRQSYHDDKVAGASRNVHKVVSEADPFSINAKASDIAGISTQKPEMGAYITPQRPVAEVQGAVTAPSEGIAPDAGDIQGELIQHLRRGNAPFAGVDRQKLKLHEVDPSTLRERMQKAQHRWQTSGDPYSYSRRPKPGVGYTVRGTGGSGDGDDVLTVDGDDMSRFSEGDEVSDGASSVGTGGGGEDEDVWGPGAYGEELDRDATHKDVVASMQKRERLQYHVVKSTLSDVGGPFKITDHDGDGSPPHHRGQQSSRSGVSHTSPSCSHRPRRKTSRSPAGPTTPPLSHTAPDQEESGAAGGEMADERPNTGATRMTSGTCMAVQRGHTSARRRTPLESMLRIPQQGRDLSDSEHSDGDGRSDASMRPSVARRHRRSKRAQRRRRFHDEDPQEGHLQQATLRRVYAERKRQKRIARAKGEDGTLSLRSSPTVRGHLLRATAGRRRSEDGELIVLPEDVFRLGDEEGDDAVDSEGGGASTDSSVGDVRDVQDVDGTTASDDRFQRRAFQRHRDSVQINQQTQEWKAMRSTLTAPKPKTPQEPVSRQTMFSPVVGEVANHAVWRHLTYGTQQAYKKLRDRQAATADDGLESEPEVDEPPLVGDVAVDGFGSQHDAGERLNRAEKKQQDLLQRRVRFLEPEAAPPSLRPFDAVLHQADEVLDDEHRRMRDMASPWGSGNHLQDKYTDEHYGLRGEALAARRATQAVLQRGKLHQWPPNRAERHMSRVETAGERATRLGLAALVHPEDRAVHELARAGILTGRSDGSVGASPRSLIRIDDSTGQVIPRESSDKVQRSYPGPNRGEPAQHEGLIAMEGYATSYHEAPERVGATTHPTGEQVRLGATVPRRREQPRPTERPLKPKKLAELTASAAPADRRRYLALDGDSGSMEAGVTEGDARLETAHPDEHGLIGVGYTLGQHSSAPSVGIMMVGMEGGQEAPAFLAAQPAEYTKGRVLQQGERGVGGSVSMGSLPSELGSMPEGDEDDEGGQETDFHSMSMGSSRTYGLNDPTAQRSDGPRAMASHGAQSTRSGASKHNRKLGASSGGQLSAKYQAMVNSDPSLLLSFSMVSNANVTKDEEEEGVVLCNDRHAQPLTYEPLHPHVYSEPHRKEMTQRVLHPAALPTDLRQPALLAAISNSSVSRSQYFDAPLERLPSPPPPPRESNVGKGLAKRELTLYTVASSAAVAKMIADGAYEATWNELTHERKAIVQARATQSGPQYEGKRSLKNPHDTGIPAPHQPVGGWDYDQMTRQPYGNDDIVIEKAQVYSTGAAGFPQYAHYAHPKDVEKLGIDPWKPGSMDVPRPAPRAPAHTGKKVTFDGHVFDRGMGYDDPILSAEARADGELRAGRRKRVLDKHTHGTLLADVPGEYDFVAEASRGPGAGGAAPPSPTRRLRSMSEIQLSQPDALWVEDGSGEGESKRPGGGRKVPPSYSRRASAAIPAAPLTWASAQGGAAVGSGKGRGGGMAKPRKGRGRRESVEVEAQSQPDVDREAVLNEPIEHPGLWKPPPPKRKLPEDPVGGENFDNKRIWELEGLPFDPYEGDDLEHHKRAIRYVERRAKVLDFFMAHPEVRSTADNIRAFRLAKVLSPGQSIDALLQSPLGRGRQSDGGQEGGAGLGEDSESVVRTLAEAAQMFGGGNEVLLLQSAHIVELPGAGSLAPVTEVDPSDELSHMSDDSRPVRGQGVEVIHPTTHVQRQLQQHQSFPVVPTGVLSPYSRDAKTKGKSSLDVLGAMGQRPVPTVPLHPSVTGEEMSLGEEADGLQLMGESKPILLVRVTAEAAQFLRQFEPDPNVDDMVLEQDGEEVDIRPEEEKRAANQRPVRPTRIRQRLGSRASVASSQPTTDHPVYPVNTSDSPPAQRHLEVNTFSDEALPQRARLRSGPQYLRAGSAGGSRKELTHTNRPKTAGPSVRGAYVPPSTSTTTGPEPTPVVDGDTKRGGEEAIEGLGDVEDVARLVMLWVVDQVGDATASVVGSPDKASRLSPAPSPGGPLATTLSGSLKEYVEVMTESSLAEEAASARRAVSARTGRSSITGPQPDSIRRASEILVAELKAAAESASNSPSSPPTQQTPARSYTPHLAADHSQSSSRQEVQRPRSQGSARPVSRARSRAASLSRSRSPMHPQSSGGRPRSSHGMPAAERSDGVDSQGTARSGSRNGSRNGSRSGRRSKTSLPRPEPSDHAVRYGVEIVQPPISKPLSEFDSPQRYAPDTAHSNSDDSYASSPQQQYHGRLMPGMAFADNSTVALNLRGRTKRPSGSSPAKGSPNHGLLPGSGVPATGAGLFAPTASQFGRPKAVLGGSANKDEFGSPTSSAHPVQRTPVHRAVEGRTFHRKDSDLETVELGPDIDARPRTTELGPADGLVTSPITKPRLSHTLGHKGVGGKAGGPLPSMHRPRRGHAVAKPAKEVSSSAPYLKQLSKDFKMIMHTGKRVEPKLRAQLQRKKPAWMAELSGSSDDEAAFTTPPQPAHSPLTAGQSPAAHPSSQVSSPPTDHATSAAQPNAGDGTAPGSARGTGQPVKPADETTPASKSTSPREQIDSVTPHGSTTTTAAAAAGSKKRQQLLDAKEKAARLWPGQDPLLRVRNPAAAAARARAATAAAQQRTSEDSRAASPTAGRTSTNATEQSQPTLDIAGPEHDGSVPVDTAGETASASTQKQSTSTSTAGEGTPQTATPSPAVPQLNPSSVEPTLTPSPEQPEPEAEPEPEPAPDTLSKQTQNKTKKKKRKTKKSTKAETNSPPQSPALPRVRPAVRPVTPRPSDQAFVKGIHGPTQPLDQRPARQSIEAFDDASDSEGSWDGGYEDGGGGWGEQSGGQRQDRHGAEDEDEDPELQTEFLISRTKPGRRQRAAVPQGWTGSLDDVTARLLASVRRKR